MDSVKSAIGLGGKGDQEGQEPTAGSQGAGTASEPFDSGNREGTYILIEDTKLPFAVLGRFLNVLYRTSG